jgi:hypothetical protein
MSNIPEALEEAIETERRNLQKVEAILGCLTLAIEYGEQHLSDAPDYSDVAAVACELLNASIVKLDSVSLEKHVHPSRRRRA